MTVNAIRAGELLIDEDTGEILSEQDPGLDELCRLLKDGTEQEKVWKAYNGALKSAVGRKLDDAGLQRALTPYGAPMFRSRTTRSAPLDRLDELIEKYGLTDVDVEQLRLCATELDPKKLDELRAAELEEIDEVRNGGSYEPPLVDVVDELIQVRTSTWVQLMPLRQSAPVVERVEIPEE